jgi:hypothetical protein
MTFPDEIVEISLEMENAGVWALRLAGVALLEAEEWEVLVARFNSFERTMNL